MLEKVETNTTRALKAIPKTEFEDCFGKWKQRWKPPARGRKITPAQRNEFRSGTHGTDLVFEIFGLTNLMKIPLNSVKI